MATVSSCSTTRTHPTHLRTHLLPLCQPRIPGLIGFCLRNRNCNLLLNRRTPDSFRASRVRNLSSEAKQKLQDPVTETDEGLTFIPFLVFFFFFFCRCSNLLNDTQLIYVLVLRIYFLIN